MMKFETLTVLCCTLSANGWYIYIETSSPRKPNDVAKLISSNVPGTTAGGGKCLSFWYHMYGADINTLGVYVRSGSVDTLLWTRTGTHGDRWLQAMITVNSRTRFQVGSGLIDQKKLWFLFKTCFLMDSVNKHKKEQTFVTFYDINEYTSNSFANVVINKTHVHTQTQKIFGNIKCNLWALAKYM